MKKPVKILLLVLLFLFAIGATFFITYREAGALYRLEMSSGSSASLKTAEISSYLERYFIDDYDEKKLADAAAEAMVEATGDRWSYYLSAEEYADYEEMMNNAYVGIGVTILESEDDGGLRIESVTPGGPADEAGIQVGDILISVEGQSALELGTSGTRDVVRGEEGTDVHLTIRRDGKDMELRVTRRSIETEVASCEMLDGKIGYIKIANFDNRCANETIDCIEQLLAQGAKALLFDVRFNGGGYKDEMVKVLDRLLPEGELFRSVDYTGAEEIDTSDAECVTLPMAVLVNEDSYSAAEFFAAALQEYEAAQVVGSKTTGKGNFQTAFRLSDGSLLNISIGKYFTPNGVSLSETGVTPDVELDLSDDDYLALYMGTLEHTDDAQLQAAVRLLREKIS